MEIYSRPDLAAKFADALVTPTPLDMPLRDGLFLSGTRRTGKTTFLRNDLIPALKKLGVIVIYVDLWSDTQIDPSKLIQESIQKTLTELETPGSKLLSLLSRVTATAEMGPFSLGFSPEAVGTSEGPTLAEALKMTVVETNYNVALVIDEAQHALTSEAGGSAMLALKAARDLVNTDPEIDRSLFIIGTGSHRAMVAEISSRRNEAFHGAQVLDYPVLGQDYVDSVLDTLKESGVEKLPTSSGAYAAFRQLGHRPVELLKSFRLIVKAGEEQPELSAAELDAQMMIVAEALRTSAADVEIARVEDLGHLACLVFDKIAQAGGETRGLFGKEFLAEYADHLGRDVRFDEVQTTLKALVSRNLVMRRSHGKYALTDPFVGELWKESADLGLMPRGEQLYFFDNVDLK